MDDAIKALKAIVEALDCDRDRLGKLRATFAQTQPLRDLAVRYNVGGCRDTVEQAVKVGRHVLNTWEANEALMDRIEADADE